MKYDYTPDNEKSFLEKLPLILLLIAGAIFLSIVLISAVFLISGKHKAGEDLRKSDPTPQKVVNLSYKTQDHVSAYTEMGQLRIITKAPSESESGTMLIVSPWFSYPEGDTVFFEELSQKDLQLKSLIANYFATHTKDQLFSNGEPTIKNELRDLINEKLILGQIRDVYFDQYIFFE